MPSRSSSILKALYDNIPFKKDLFSLLKKIYAPPEKVYQHLHFKGLIKIHITRQKYFKMIHYGYKLENDLFWTGLNGNWEAQSMKIWTTLCKESKTIFDLGANTGVYSLVAKVINPDSDVHAFEPFGSICEKLNQNNAINDFDININCEAVSNYTGEGTIYSENPDFAYSVTVNKNLWVKDKDPIAIKIKTITLKEYIEKEKIERIDLMKIDVETHEPEVIEGFGEYLYKLQPIILIEVLTDECAHKLSNYFKPELFEFYNIHEKQGITKSDYLTKSTEFNYLIIPKGKVNAVSKMLASSTVRY